MPGRLDRPVWEDVPEIDVDAHFRQATVDPPGGERRLDALVGDIFGRPLDRSRPLWELWRIDGLRDGGIALLLKIHHACIDGLHAAEFASLIFDLAPDAPLERPELAPVPAPQRDGHRSYVADTAIAVATTPVRAARVAADVVRAAPRLARFALSRARAASLLPFEAPASPLNGTLTPRRGFVFASIPLADVYAVREAFGVSVNDVVLAVFSGSLRRYLGRARRAPAAHDGGPGPDGHPPRRPGGRSGCRARQPALGDGRGAARQPRRPRRPAPCRARVHAVGTDTPPRARRRPARRPRGGAAARGALGAGARRTAVCASTPACPRSST